MLLITEMVCLPATAVVVIVVMKIAATKPVRIIVLVLWLIQLNNFHKGASYFKMRAWMWLQDSFSCHFVWQQLQVDQYFP